MSKNLQSYIKDYNQYRFMAGIVAGMAASNLINQNIIGAVLSAGYTFFLKKVSDNAKKQSKNAYEFQILNRFYCDILDEIAKNIKKLELGDIEGIFAYICYLYEHNYLSYDRHLPPFNQMPIFNEGAVLAALSLNNHGVCRNKAPMLVDLYKLFDIEAYGLIGTYFESQHIIFADSEILSEMEMKEIIGDEEINPAQILKLLEKVSERFEAKIEEEKEYLNSLPTGNHAITQANSKDHTYLLDPTKKDFYIDADEEGRYFSNMGNYFKIVNVKKKKNNYKDHLVMEIVDKKPIMEKAEMNDILDRRKKVIEDNQDIVEEMHKDIAPILELAEDAYKMILQAR
ncbi:MAG: hypothetical protein K2G03_04310 [Bacilli bacterium]|nr:hypothetical protein [Bacilli bacterium]